MPVHHPAELCTRATHGQDDGATSCPLMIAACAWAGPRARECLAIKWSLEIVKGCRLDGILVAPAGSTAISKPRHASDAATTGARRSNRRNRRNTVRA